MYMPVCEFGNLKKKSCFHLILFFTMRSGSTCPIAASSSPAPGPVEVGALQRKADAPASGAPGTGQTSKQKSVTGGLQAKTVRSHTTSARRTHPTHH